MSNRYQIRRGSNSAHCCFVATIVDTKTLKSGDAATYETVAEFFDRRMARLTCKALNMADVQQQRLLIYRKVRGKQNKLLRGSIRKAGADHSEEVAALRAARALKKLNKENSNG